MGPPLIKILVDENKVIHQGKKMSPSLFFHSEITFLEEISLPRAQKSLCSSKKKNSTLRVQRAQEVVNGSEH
jgi:hypothetical protein